MPAPVLMRRLTGGPTTGLAARFDGVAQTYMERADSASLSMGVGVRLTIALWLYTEAPASVATLLSKGFPAIAGSLEYGLITNASRFEFRVSNGAALTAVVANTFGAVPANAWSFVVCRYDGANILIKVNDGADNNTGFSADMPDTTNAFRLGNRPDGLQGFTGRQDCVGLWRRALSDAECTQLYNGGLGLAAGDLDAGLRVGIGDFWNLNGSGLAFYGGNDLTLNGGVTYTAGKR